VIWGVVRMVSTVCIPKLELGNERNKKLSQTKLHEITEMLEEIK